MIQDRLVRKIRYALYGLSGLVAAIVIICAILSSAPSNFPENVTFRVEKGMSLSQAAEKLREAGIIRSTFFFKAYSMLLSGGSKIQAGNYLFEGPQSSLRVAYRTVHGMLGLPQVGITIYEGMTAEDIADLVKKKIPGFDSAAFVKLAKPSEGYLFPDTYYIYENTDPEYLFDLLRQTFDRKIQAHMIAVRSSGRSLSDIIKMASIVEREAGNSRDRRLIAGILWKRLEKGMPLQVDAPFYYILNKSSSELTVEDLAIGSPFNLYKHTGLPPSPIANPGLEAIADTLRPISTNYWYYLSDKKGDTHYAETYEAHLANKSKYIP